MNMIMFQVSTVCLLILLTIIEFGGILWGEKPMDSRDVVLWTVHANRIGVPRDDSRTKRLFREGQDQEVGLCEERYLVGNRLTDDLYLDTGGSRVRLYINVQPDRLFLTVIQGCAYIDHYIYEADESRRIEIPDRARVVIHDLELDFIRRRVS